MKVIPLSEAKAKLSGLVQELAETEEEVIITKNGRAAAVLMSASEYESWKETQAIRSDPKFMREIRAGIRALNTGKAKAYRSAAAFFRDNR
jgi:prevent-host-death family protein